MTLNFGTRIKFNNGITYEVIDQIGTGGQGAVYRAKNLDDKQSYALKILVDSNEKRKELKKKNIHTLINEKANGDFNEIGEPYQIRYTFPLSSCEYEGETLYVMELAHGVTLEKIMNSETDAICTKDMKYKLHLSQKIARAIEVLERRGKSYSDINCGNFMYDEGPDWLYVVDCENVASNIEIQEGLAFVLGNGYFMAPEVAFGKANAGKNADRYALANMIFRILINNQLQSPYDGKAMYSVLPRADSMLGVKEYVDEGELDEAWSVFIFDETDRRNSIDDLYANANANQPKLQRKRHKFDEVIRIWNSLDDRLKALFRQAFKDPLKEESYEGRPSPRDWINRIESVLNPGTGRTPAPSPVLHPLRDSSLSPTPTSSHDVWNFKDYPSLGGGTSSDQGSGASTGGWNFKDYPSLGGGTSSDQGLGAFTEDWNIENFPAFGGGADGRNGQGEVKPTDPQKDNEP